MSGMSWLKGAKVIAEVITSTCRCRRTKTFKSTSFLSNYNFRVFVYKKYSSCVNVTTPSEKMVEKKKFERLPTSVKPTVYDLFLKPDLKTFRFDGKEVVYVQILQPTDKIVLNSLDLKITQAQLKLIPSGEVLTPECVLCEEDETLKLNFSKALPIGEAELVVEFVGELNDLMKGFYRGKYTAVAGQEDKYYAVTQFEATDARRCFPCWDEPAIKARFDITLAVDADKLALSNMPVEKEHVSENGVKVVKFQRTPIMSTYLVALVVGNFDYVEDKSSDGVLVKVYTPPGKKEQGRFALYVATKILPYYKEYFQVAYPLPKMDLIAIPDMSAGAMENWGLVTYRETYLLVDEANTSAATKQTVAIVVGHELAHQWFGNLVTMEWWTDLWLNEGYASFVEFLCVAYLFPEYDIWTQFVTDLHCRALELDALKSSHPVEVPVGHPSEIDEIFDDISYGKGGSVIRMLHKYIGDDDFRRGMNLYLTRHQYGNTHTEDLWAALEESSSKPVKAVMPTWTKQKGFPVITVESSVQEDDVRTLVVSQTKFCAEASEQDNESQWLVPLSFSKQSNPKEECFSTILEARQSKISIPNVAPGEWVKLNPGTVGFYRTKYPLELLKQLIPSVSDKTLPPLDRLGILDDLFALVLSGQANAIGVLDLMLAMTDEDNYTVWTNMATCLEKIYTLLSNTEYDYLYNAYGLKLVKPIYKKLGVDPKPGESHLITLLRSLILNRLIKFGDDEFLALAQTKFAEHYNSTKIIPADLRGVFYKAAIAADGKSAFDSLLDMYKKTDLQEEKERILRSFSSITDPDLVDDVLKFAQSNDVTPASAVTTLASVASSKAGREKSWQYLKSNWESLYEKYRGGFLITRIVKYTTENYASEEKAKEIEEFFASKEISGVERTVRQCLETVRNNAAWLKRDGDSIKSYLEKLQ